MMQKEISYFQELNQGDQFSFPMQTQIYNIIKVGDFEIECFEITKNRKKTFVKKVNYGRLIWLLKRGSKNG